MDDADRSTKQNDNDRDTSHAQAGRGWQDLESATLDMEVDAALVQYAAAEPRAGLADRILANLREEQRRAEEHSRWRWPTIAAVAAMLVIALSLAWQSSRSTLDITAQRSAITGQSDQQAHLPVVANDTAASNHRAPPATAKRTSPTMHRVRRSRGLVKLAPRLAQFPSPRPLSKQEELLVNFVQEFPQEAVLIARAQAESEKKLQQSSKDQASGTNADQQDEQER